MDSLIKSLAKMAALNVGFTRPMMLQREFLRSTPSCRGLFSSFAEAHAAAPASEWNGYDHRAIAEVYAQGVGQFNPADYPVIFWLGRLLPETRVVFDLGGSIGLSFYAYQRYLDFPAALRWIVCDLPAMASVGEEIARARNVPQLVFTSERETPDDPDIYATFGTLQYIEEPFASIVSRLRKRPPHILINRVPLTEGDAFITLQNNGSWFSPYKVDKKSDLIRSLENLDYEVVDEWVSDRPNSFLMDKDVPPPKYCGMCLRRK